MIARLKSTFNVQQFGFKGNVGSHCIHGLFITLQQLLVETPPSVPFDIELSMQITPLPDPSCKVLAANPVSIAEYPMLFEARDFDMDPIIMELNLFLDTLLSVVYQYGGNRPMFFSSFSPELCILLSTKQRLYPVFFLTESGYIPTRDIRAISCQEAVRLAKKWDLAGVVIRSQPFVASPMLVSLIKDSGLVCASWGDLNNDLHCAKVKLPIFSPSYDLMSVY